MATNSELNELNDMTDLHNSSDLPDKQNELRNGSIRFKNAADRLKKLTVDNIGASNKYYSAYQSFLDNWVGLSIVCVTIYNVSWLICETIVKLHQ